MQPQAPWAKSDFSASALPHFGFKVVDVRDIAASRLLAMTTPSDMDFLLRFSIESSCASIKKQMRSLR
jgi:hypothetical protein